MDAPPAGAVRPRAHAVSVSPPMHVHGWKITSRKGPIISDKDVDDFRQAVGEHVKSLPEMLFSSSRVTFLHEPSGIALDFTAVSALRAWHQEGLPPLQVKVAKEWKAARQQEIENQRAIQLLYDWTFTTPYSGDVVRQEQASLPMAAGDTGHYGPPAAPDSTASTPSTSLTGNATPATTPATPDSQATGTTGATGTDSSSAAAAASEEEPAAGTSSLPAWQETDQQIDRALLMERDPILFFDQVQLFESDLDDNGISQVTVKLRVMPKAWLILLRFWLRVDGCIVRLRETRLFCRHDTPEAARIILREQRHFEGTLAELRAAGAPGDNSAYADGDAAAQVFEAVAPIGSKLYALHKLELPAPL